jgi:hypothetical protein
MVYIATYYVPGERTPREKPYDSLNGALRFLVHGMHDGSLFPGQLLDDRGRAVASHDWLLDHWSDVLAVLDAGDPPTSRGPGADLV